MPGHAALAQVAARGAPGRARARPDRQPRRTRIDPEHEALLADSVGLALLVVLETLAPAERLAFVLHDMFAVPFDEIAAIVGRSPTAARQLASRARRRVQGAATVPDADLTRQREVVDAFLAAARGGDFDALLAVLDPDVVAPSRPRSRARGRIEGGPRRGPWPSRRPSPDVPGRTTGARERRRGRSCGPARAAVSSSTSRCRTGRSSQSTLFADPERLRQLDLAYTNRHGVCQILA